MSRQVTIGGDRLGSGKRMKADMHGYERSSHDLGYDFRTTIAPGTLVPFLAEVALPGDTFDIDVDGYILTHPTIGPEFGSMKLQIDLFQTPIRLYNAGLHMNMVNIGRDMSKVLLPQIKMEARTINPDKPIDNQQINPSCIFSYLNIRGLGQSVDLNGTAERHFNGLTFLMYWDIVKNYYSNKQEEIGAVIHQDTSPYSLTITEARFWNATPSIATNAPDDPLVYQNTTTQYFGPADPSSTYVEITFTTEPPDNIDMNNIKLYIKIGTTEWVRKINEIFNHIETIDGTNKARVFGLKSPYRNITMGVAGIEYVDSATPQLPGDTKPEIVTFPLENIDNMRKAILAKDMATAMIIDENSPIPYSLPLASTFITGEDYYLYAKEYGQEGLALKTYQSDLFNNWISTEWVDGANGIAEVTAIDVSGGSLMIDEINLHNKIYNMLNRIALSGGTYDDWQEVTYDHTPIRRAENPMYIGGQMKNIVFQEVFSTAATDEQPLATLAGRGRMGHVNKGGKVIARIDEPSYIMGIVSITPYLDYSQGNKWDTNLRTMDDFHKPALDQIGWQDLITDQMAWWDTSIATDKTLQLKSAGKQPAWLNYMTNVNVVRGNFADEMQQMFMTLNRRYEPTFEPNLAEQPMPSIKDLTTYIDPAKFNYIFADTRRDAQNFWLQIAVNIHARRKMSAKQIPNL